MVISHTPHHRGPNGIVGWAPTVREIDQLATRFTDVRHIACQYPGPAPESAVGYRQSNVQVVPVPPAGAPGLLGKLDVLRTSPKYVSTIHRELRNADMVHVRAPANIALIAMMLLAGRQRPAARWFKYAGNWRPTDDESPSYAVQRWWLQSKNHGLVTVNGRWPGQPPWVRSFYNPSLDDADLERGKAAAEKKHVTTPVQLVYVGQLLESKGGKRAIEIAARLRQLGVAAELELLGDGIDRTLFEQRARELDVTDVVRFAGWQPPERVRESYARAHFVVLPSASEGWPKVLSEGMAYGALPLAGAVSAIPQQLEAFGVGRALEPSDTDAFAHAIARYVTHPRIWQDESTRAVAAAEAFSFRQYLAAVDSMLRELGFGTPPR